MDLIKTHDWFYTQQNELRGYIDSQRLQELWLHTGTACNLSCPFCLEGSKPGDTRLEGMGFDDAKPFIDEAVELGVEHFCFTGGEPFVARDFTRILAYASMYRPCLVLTNGTDPLLKQAHDLVPLVCSTYPLSFRVSIDAPDAEIHDRGRGQGSFAKAMQGLRLLNTLGFKVSVARQLKQGEDCDAVERRYRRILAAHALPPDIPIMAFPDFATPFSSRETPEITESCMSRYSTEEVRRQFMCAYSKMLVKQDGGMRIYACPLVDDDRYYAFEGSLADSLSERIMLRHHRCYSCFAYGASYSEM